MHVTICSGDKAAESCNHTAGHPSPFYSDVKKAWIFNATPSISLSGVELSCNETLVVFYQTHGVASQKTVIFRNFDNFYGYGVFKITFDPKTAGASEGLTGL
jgi:hypothetical protein